MDGATTEVKIAGTSERTDSATPIAARSGTGSAALPVPDVARPPSRRKSRFIRPMGGTRVVSAGVGGMLVTALWIGMFTVGLSVPSSPFRNGLLALAGGEPAAGTYPVNSVFDAIYALLIVCFSYTPTNLAMLCCLASLVGCLGQIATSEPDLIAKTNHELELARGADASRRDDELPTGVIPLRPAISAVTWGFFIYLFLISGTLLATQNPFASTTPDQYLRLAGTASLLAFVVGWQPEVLNRLVAQIGQARIAGQGGGDSGAAGTGAGNK